MNRNVIGLIILGVFFSACSPHFHIDFLGDSKLHEVVLRDSSQKEKILMLDVSGTIQSTTGSGLLDRESDPVSGITLRLKKASRDPLIKGVILKLNTPGGEGTASDIIYHEIVKFREKTGLPVVALMMGVAASGGYYVAQACDVIMAHPTTITGSIGVIAVMPNFNIIMSRLGVKVNVIKSGRMKDAGSPYREMTFEEKAHFQSLIDAMYENFLQVIFENRKSKLSMEKIESLADGRVYIAREALELKLIDEIGYFDSALERVLEMAEIKEADVVVYSHYPRKKTSVYGSSFSAAETLKIEIKGLDRLIPGLEPGLYYLWLPAMTGE